MITGVLTTGLEITSLPIGRDTRYDQYNELVANVSKLPPYRLVGILGNYISLSELYCLEITSLPIGRDTYFLIVKYKIKGLEITSLPIGRDTSER